MIDCRSFRQLLLAFFLDIFRLLLNRLCRIFRYFRRSCQLLHSLRPSTEVNVPENPGERTKAIASSCDDVIFWDCDVNGVDF